MAAFFHAGGVFMYPLLAIAIAEIALILRHVFALRAGRPAPSLGVAHGVHAILFWGVIALVIGVLGQSTGLYNALTAISRASEISPHIVAQGIAQSFTTTLAGFMILLGSAIAWLVLVHRYRRGRALEA